jgi:hypothetical protein
MVHFGESSEPYFSVLGCLLSHCTSATTRLEAVLIVMDLGLSLAFAVGNPVCMRWRLLFPQPSLQGETGVFKQKQLGQVLKVMCGPDPKTNY